MRVSTNTDEVAASTPDINVVVCCAFGDLTDVRKVESTLTTDGVHVHWVPGVDRELEGFAVHLLAQQEPTVFAVAHSAAMPSEPLEALIALFGRERGTDHRLSVVEFDRVHPEKFVRAVRDSVSTMRSHAWRSAASHDADDTPPSRRPRKSRPHLSTRPQAPLHRSTGPQRPVSTGALLDEAPSSELECLLLDGLPPGATDSAETLPNLRAAVERVQAASTKRTAATRIKIVAALVTTAILVAAFALWKASSDDDAPATPPSVVEASVVATPQRAAATPSAKAKAKATKIDGLEALPPSQRAMSFTTARIRCGRKRSKHGHGWRLPSIEQLHDLHNAQALPSGTFWSSTQSDDGQRLTLSQDGREAKLLGSTPVGAHVLCVRKR